MGDEEDGMDGMEEVEDGDERIAHTLHTHTPSYPDGGTAHQDGAYNRAVIARKQTPPWESTARDLSHC
jgi:hypothetical protein